MPGDYRLGQKQPVEATPPLGVLSQIGALTLERYVDPKQGGRGAFVHLEPPAPSVTAG